MYVTAILQLAVAQELHQQQPRLAASEQLIQLAQELNVLLEPLHPGETDPYLVPYFKVEVPDQTTADRVIFHFQTLDAIEGAYIKPSAELP
ncbi:MAG: hypothetical protein AB4050_08390 [Synechococcus sp.]